MGGTRRRIVIALVLVLLTKAVTLARPSARCATWMPGRGSRWRTFTALTAARC